MVYPIYRCFAGWYHDPDFMSAKGESPLAKRALLLLDVQDDFLGNTLDYIAALSQRYLDEHAKDYDLVVLTYWLHQENAQQNTLLLEHESAHVVTKTTYSGYNDETASLLKENGITEVHVGGVDAEMSVLATMFRLLDEKFDVKLLERLIASYHGKNTSAMGIARQVLGHDNMLPDGGQRVWI